MTERDPMRLERPARDGEPAICVAPPGARAVPPYDDGWAMGDGEPEPFLSYVADDPSVNWSVELEELHEESSRVHFLDRWTRGAIVQGLGELAPDSTIADIGCSTGFLLEDLHTAYPTAKLIGVDLVTSGLRKAHRALPAARLLHADACALPLGDGTVDAVVSANLLEHVPDDRRAVREIARVLAPGARVAIAVPAGPRTYDYYDRFLGHERRYRRGELAAKCADAGLHVVHDGYIAGLLYPAFWLVKQRNRRRFDDLRGAQLEQRVTADIRRTRDSRIGHKLWRLEASIGQHGVKLPFGIRSIVVAQAPLRPV